MHPLVFVQYISEKAEHRVHVQGHGNSKMESSRYYRTSHTTRDLKIDNAASSKTRCQYISTERSFLEFDCFNNHLKLVLVTYRYFCWPKRYAFCYKLDFQNASYVVACFRVAQGT